MSDPVAFEKWREAAIKLFDLLSRIDAAAQGAGDTSEIALIANKRWDVMARSCGGIVPRS